MWQLHIINKLYWVNLWMKKSFKFYFKRIFKSIHNWLYLSSRRLVLRVRHSTPGLGLSSLDKTVPACKPLAGRPLHRSSPTRRFPQCSTYHLSYKPLVPRSLPGNINVTKNVYAKHVSISYGILSKTQIF